MVFKEPFKPFLSNLMETIMQKALEDGVITPEESLLLSQIEVDIKAFEKELAECLEDNPSEKPREECFKEKLIGNVRNIALADGQISKDEEAILTRLEEYFTKTKFATD